MVDKNPSQPEFLPFLQDQAVINAAESDPSLANLMQNLVVVSLKIEQDRPFVNQNDELLRDYAEERVAMRLTELRIARTRIEPGDDR